MSTHEKLTRIFYDAVVRYTPVRLLRDVIYSQVSRTRISETESAALEAGDAGFEADLLNGKPDWNNLLNKKILPAPQLSAEEQAFLDGPVEELCAMVNDWEVRNSKEADLPEDVWQFMKDQKFFGMIIPKEHEGLGFSALAHSAVVQKLSSRSVTAAVTAMVPNSLGPAELVERYGTDEQKHHYLPRLANGREIPCFALTEPNAGSDAGGMTSSGTVFKDEDGKIKIRMNIDKRYITLSSVATLLGVAFQLKDPDDLLKKGKEGITVALVSHDTPGIETGRRHNPLGHPFHNGLVKGKDVVIPIENIIGGEEKAGKGWGMLMECLAVGRSISLPAQATGGAKFASWVTGMYSRVRRQFKVPLSAFEGIHSPLARMAGTTYMMDAARTATAQMVDQGKKPSVLSAVVKYHLTEAMRDVVNDAMDIHGGKGLSLGPRNYLAGMYQGVPIGITVEGANILTRNMIIFNQASMRSHNFLLGETKEAIAKDKEKFTTLMAEHVRQSMNNGVRTLWMGVTDGHFGKTPVKGPGKRYYQQIDRLSSGLATMADTTYLLLGAKMKTAERVTARLGDVMSHLYLASATLRHFEVQGCKKEDEPLMHWACQHALSQAETAMSELIRNYPRPEFSVKSVGKAVQKTFTNIPKAIKETQFLKVAKNTLTLKLGKAFKGVMPLLKIPLPLMMPVAGAIMKAANIGMSLLTSPLSAVPFMSGKRLHPPSDRLEKKVAEILLNKNDARDRLAEGIFMPTAANDHVAEITGAFNDALAAEPVEDKINAARRLARKQNVSEKEKIISRDMKDIMKEAIIKGIITEDEEALIHKADASRIEAVKVDDFPIDLGRGTPVPANDQSDIKKEKKRRFTLE